MSIAERLIAKIEIRGPDDCWPWRAVRNSNGYGYITLSQPRQNALAHRLMEEMARGRLVPGQVVRHSCDNPSCCNPAHLHRGTQSENMRDCAAKGRLNTTPSYGQANGQAKLTEEIVCEMRARYPATPTRALAREFGVSRSLVHRVVTGRAWAHIARQEAAA